MALMDIPRGQLGPGIRGILISDGCDTAFLFKVWSSTFQFNVWCVAIMQKMFLERCFWLCLGIYAMKKVTGTNPQFQKTEIKNVEIGLEMF